MISESVFTKKIGDQLQRGERVGLIKFGSRTDVIFPAGAQMKVSVGDHVKGGSSVLARLPVSTNGKRATDQRAPASAQTLTAAGKQNS